jgi:hypothetical protein
MAALLTVTTDGISSDLPGYQPAEEPLDNENLHLLVCSSDPVIARASLPRIAAVGWLPTAAAGGLAGRPGPSAAGLAGLYLAGDWIGPAGFLADASFASARPRALALGHAAPDR